MGMRLQLASHAANASATGLVRVVTEEAHRTRLLDRIGVLEMENMRLYGMLSVERDMAGSIRQ
nr:hypothetical protein [Tanacetum cinerariifolium]